MQSFTYGIAYKTIILAVDRRLPVSLMINVYGGFGLVPGARNVWSHWIDHILKQRERFGFVAATMITTQGVVSAFTKDFLPTTAEVQVLSRIFEDGDEEINQLSFCNNTYVIKVKPTSVAEPACPRILVAFSGSKYVLVCRSLTKYIIVQTEGRRGEQWLNDAVKWLTKLGQKLIDKKY